MKKVAYFFFSFVPVLAVLAIQFIASYAVLGPAAFTVIMKGSNISFYNTLMELATDSMFNTVVMVVYALITISSFSIWYYCSYEGNFIPIIPKGFSFKMFLAIILLVPGTQFLSDYICELINVIRPDWIRQYLDLIDQAGIGSTDSLLMVAYSVILAPVCEELIFRGVTLQSIKRALPFWGANIFQAVLFGLFHGNWVQGIYAFSIGLVLGYVYEKGGSIYCSILFHMLFNAWGVFLSKYIQIEDGMLFLIITIPITIISFAVGFILYRPKRYASPK